MSSTGEFAAVTAGVIAFMAGAVALAYFAGRAVDLGDATERKQRSKVYRQTLVEGLSISRRGLCGVDLVRCKSCHIEKRKQGIFTLGGFNVLVLDDLDIVLPRVEDSDRSPAEGDDDSPRDMARRIGVSDSFLCARGIPLSFSGLKIRGLSVGRLTVDNKPEVAFTAKSAEAVRGGLKLSGCVVHSADRPPVQVSDAMLARYDRKLCLTWNGGKIDLN